MVTPHRLANSLEVFRANAGETDSPTQRSRWIFEGYVLPHLERVLPVLSRLQGKIVPAPLVHLLFVGGRDMFPRQPCVQRAAVRMVPRHRFDITLNKGLFERPNVPWTPVGPAPLQKL